jgi:hypothetical protein
MEGEEEAERRGGQSRRSACVTADAGGGKGEGHDVGRGGRRWRGGGGGGGVEKAPFTRLTFRRPRGLRERDNRCCARRWVGCWELMNEFTRAVSEG